MSLVTLVLCALVLNYVPGGIRDRPWAVSSWSWSWPRSRLAAIERQDEGPRVRSREAALRAEPRRPRPAAAAGSSPRSPPWSSPQPLYSADDVGGYTRLWMLPNATRDVRSGSGSLSNEQAADVLPAQVRLAGRDLMKRTAQPRSGRGKGAARPIPRAGAGSRAASRHRFTG